MPSKLKSLKSGFLPPINPLDTKLRLTKGLSKDVDSIREDQAEHMFNQLKKVEPEATVKISNL